jgi:hypothetical protein
MGSQSRPSGAPSLPKHPDVLLLAAIGYPGKFIEQSIAPYASEQPNVNRT